QLPRSKIHWALNEESSLACWAPPRKDRLEVMSACACWVVAVLRTRLTYPCNWIGAGLVEGRLKTECYLCHLQRVVALR
ncbi:hypothetical protein PHMEG_00034730, partial [Phytophthora megakarya]